MRGGRAVDSWTAGGCPEVCSSLGGAISDSCVRSGGITYVIVQMYMKEPAEDFADVRMTPALGSALAIAAFGTLYLGILPTRLFEWTATAALNFLH